nr:MAG TPA: hypothetical protein [Caudoviricetes sp.]
MMFVEACTPSFHLPPKDIRAASIVRMIRVAEGISYECTVTRTTSTVKPLPPEMTPSDWTVICQPFFWGEYLSGSVADVRFLNTSFCARNSRTFAVASWDMNRRLSFSSMLLSPTITFQIKSRRGCRLGECPMLRLRVQTTRMHDRHQPHRPPRFIDLTSRFNRHFRVRNAASVSRNLRSLSLNHTHEVFTQHRIDSITIQTKSEFISHQHHAFHT